MLWSGSIHSSQEWTVPDISHKLAESYVFGFCQCHACCRPIIVMEKAICHKDKILQLASVGVVCI